MLNFLYDRYLMTPGREAIYDFDHRRSYTYATLYRRSCRLSRYLTEKIGLKKGDCIGFLASNHIAHFDAFYSSFQTGIIVTTYNQRLHTNDLLQLIRNEDPKVLFYEGNLSDKINELRKHFPSIRFVSLNFRASDADCLYEELMEMGGDRSPVKTPIDPEDIQMYIHTGGTSGLPKAAMISFRSFFYNCVSDILTNALQPDDCSCLFLPLFHTAGWNIITIPLQMCGGRVILTGGRFDAGKYLEIIREMRPTVGMAVPSAFKKISEHPDFMKTDFSSFKWLSSGGAGIQEPVMNAFLDRGIRIANGYGMTEVGPHNLTTPLVGITVEKIRERLESVGKPQFFNEIRIVDENFRDVPDGECGELLFKGPLVFSGYLNNPEETAAVFSDGWVRTGDIARKDSDGYYYIAGRKKFMFVSGGENIYPQEIELALTSHPSVQEACVIGVRDPSWGEVGKAILVVDRKTYRERDLREYLKDKLSTIKIPKYFLVVDEIPTNSAGKRNMTRIHQLYGYDIFKKD